LKNTLIICYSFPPNPGVGGRRWAKFAKFLAKSNHELIVVAQLNKENSKSEWLKDIESEKIEKIYLDQFYPKAYYSSPNSILQKILYRFWLAFFYIFSKGSLYDKSFFWNSVINKKIKKIIIENNIKNVIVSGPPFRMMYYTARLKESHNFNFILDFRDPWTDNTTLFGFKNLSEKRMKFEREIEDFSVRKADHVISANEYLTDIYQNRYPNQREKFKTIINGYDPDEIKLGNSLESKRDNGTIKFVLAGTLYSNLEYIFVPFLDFLRRLESENNELFNKITFDFYGAIDAQLKKIIETYNLKNVFLNGHKPLNVVREEMINCEFCLIFTAPNLSSNFNTKFYEAIAIKKPIVHFSNNGKISQFIFENKLGYNVTPDNLATEFMKILEDYFSDKIIYDEKFDSSDFNIECLTRELKNILV